MVTAPTFQAGWGRSNREVRLNSWVVRLTEESHTEGRVLARQDVLVGEDFLLGQHEWAELSSDESLDSPRRLAEALERWEGKPGAASSSAGKAPPPPPRGAVLIPKGKQCCGPGCTRSHHPESSVQRCQVRRVWKAHHGAAEAVRCTDFACEECGAWIEMPVTGSKAKTRSS